MASSIPTSPSLFSSSMSRRNYGVFLSFRGPDSRNTIVSHLYNALCQKGVYVFKDNEELEAGQRRSELFEAIEGSQIAVVMFSENYARSRWCLDELKKIIDCKDQGKLIVLPIFYRVSPGEVRLHDKENGEKGCYQAAMEEMEAKYGKDSVMVKGWKKALWQGGDMIGIQLGQGQDEGTVVREVIENILKKLDRVPLEVAKHPVGIDRNLEAIRPLQHISPHENNVYMVGIVGEGGMGKTTISKAICNNIVNRFDEWCFLPNVRETSRVVNGLALLQQTLLRQLLNNKDLMVWSVHEGKQLIKERLRNKRVLVILDDVDELAQFDALAGNLDWFGKGSRIIITTRNSHLLPSDRVQHVYKVSLLEKAEADSLFRLHAFGERRMNINIDRDLIERFVDYASQLPLALVVLGAFLHDRSPSEWEGKLNELGDSPDRTINSVLRISFDGLEDKHREIFLDVACFFKGWYIDKVEKILDSCDFATSLGIGILVEQCLVTVDGGIIQMHDLVGVMGQNIVREDYLKGVGLPSRIWLYEDFLEVLSKNMTQEKHGVKGIVLNLTEKKDCLIKPNALMGFKNLKIFIARNVDGPKEPLRLPVELRWLEWKGCSASSVEFDQSSNKIVNLDLEESMITKIVGKGFKELKYVNLWRCENLATLPDLSKSSKLGYLSLRDCRRLIEVPELPNDSIYFVDATGCFNLRTFPSLHTFICRSPRSYVVHLSGCGLGHNFLVESLPLEKVRKFTGAASVVCTANELPQWVNFRTTECGSRYRVSLPRSVSEDDILGLTFFITVNSGFRPFGILFSPRFVGPRFMVKVGGNRLRVGFDGREAVYTWFVYIPRQPIIQSYEILNWHSITFELEFLAKNELDFRSLGLRMLCKREEDDQLIRVRKIESNETDSSESEYESAYECLCESDYESASSEWKETTKKMKRSKQKRKEIPLAPSIKKKSKHKKGENIIPLSAGQARRHPRFVLRASGQHTVNSPNLI